jgi:hypothetical protein
MARTFAGKKWQEYLQDTSFTTDAYHRLIDEHTINLLRLLGVGDYKFFVFDKNAFKSVKSLRNVTDKIPIHHTYEELVMELLQSGL